MASFVYTAVDKNGKKVKGNIEADSPAAASAELKKQGLTTTKVDKATALNSEIDISFLQKQPKPRDIAVFCRQMVSVLSAGVPLAQALEMLGDQTENLPLATAIRGCKKSIESGSPLSEALADYPKIFSDIFCLMIEAGERSGALETSFDRLAVRSEKDAELKGMIKKATTYPIIIGIVAVAVVIFMLVFLVPKFEDMLASMGSELPALTKAIVAASDFVMGHIPLCVAVVVAIIFGIRVFKRSTFGSRLIDKLMLKIPLFGQLTIKSACSSFMRTMATLISTGIPMIEALDITKNVMTNSYYEMALDDIKREVTQGTPLSEAIESTNLFPPMVYHMTAIGEETGKLTEMFDRCANYYDEEVKTATESVTAAIEPMVIVVLAGLVGTILVALMMPMMSMYSGLDNL